MERRCLPQYPKVRAAAGLAALSFPRGSAVLALCQHRGSIKEPQRNHRAAKGESRRSANHAQPQPGSNPSPNHIAESRVFTIVNVCATCWDQGGSPWRRAPRSHPASIGHRIPPPKRETRGRAFWRSRLFVVHIVVRRRLLILSDSLLPFSAVILPLPFRSCGV